VVYRWHSHVSSASPVDRPSGRSRRCSVLESRAPLEEEMNVQPLEDRIVVRPAESETTTASGLVIPDTAKEKPQQGEVLAVGPGRTTDDGKVVAMTVKVGDRVLYSKYGGTEVTVKGEDLLILNSRDVLAIMG
jgi:chaperonin GroES